LAQNRGARLNRLVAPIAGKLLKGGRAGISFELAEAWELPPSPAAPADLTDAQRSVFSWLVAYKQDIVAAEDTWQIDRRAIAGAIAWEALENLNYVSPFLVGCGRAAGPGKVHYKSNMLIREGMPVAKQVELAGYLPVRSVASRKRILRTPQGSVEYIGAIMCAYADIGFQCGFEGLRTRDDLILTQPYQGVRRIGELDELDSWRVALTQHKERGTDLAPRNRMYRWVNERRNLDFLEAATGRWKKMDGKAAYRGPRFSSRHAREDPVDAGRSHRDPRSS
jgi:hypothetical protein